MHDGVPLERRRSPRPCGAGVGGAGAPGSVAAPAGAPQPVRPSPALSSRFLGHATIKPGRQSHKAAASTRRSAAAARRRGRPRHRAAFPGLQASVRRRSRCQTRHVPSTAQICMWVCSDVQGTRADCAGGCSTQWLPYTLLVLAHKPQSQRCMQHSKSAVNGRSSTWGFRHPTSGLGSSRWLRHTPAALANMPTPNAERSLW